MYTFHFRLLSFARLCLLLFPLASLTIGWTAGRFLQYLRIARMAERLSTPQPARKARRLGLPLADSAGRFYFDQPKAQPSAESAKGKSGVAGLKRHIG